MKKISIFILLFICLILSSCQKSLDESKNVTIYYFDVGQGDSTLIITPDNESILIDAGNNNKANLVVNYLKDLKIKKLNYIIATHPDADHVGGLDVVIDSFDVDNVYAPNVTHTTKSFHDFLNSVKNKNLKIKIGSSGVKLPIKSVDAIFLSPVKEKYSNLNEYSLVLSLSYKKRNFLFMGDATETNESEILNQNPNLKVDVLKLGHHGSSSSSSEIFLSKIKPKYGVISCSKNNSYGHPSYKVLKRLKNQNIKILRTDKQKSIKLESNGENIIFYKKPILE